MGRSGPAVRAVAVAIVLVLWCGCGAASEATGRAFGQLDSPEVSISSRLYEVAVGAVAGVLGMVDAVMSDPLHNGVCEVRPPGHHADRAMALCIFNNVAVAALLQKHGLSRALIVDWDGHHGNCTQAAFERNPRVMYFSTHRSPWHPGTGHEDGRGEGNIIINVPLPTGSGDEALKQAFETRLVSAAHTFKPHERDDQGPRGADGDRQDDRGRDV